MDVLMFAGSRQLDENREMEVNVELVTIRGKR